MSKISGYFVLAVLAMAAPSLPAATIIGDPQYNATADCNNACVTVSLEWQGAPTPVRSVVVDDSLGDFLFSLTVPFPGSTTGSIVPDPQTISGLPSAVIAAITNSVTYTYLGSTLVIAPAGVNAFPSSPPNPAPFSLPEPAAWSLTAAGLGLLFVWDRARHQKGAAVLELESTRRKPQFVVS